MPITIDTVYLVDGTLRPNLTNISWALWSTKDITIAPDESGSGLSTGAGSELTVPSTANDGILLLRVDDVNMGLYDAAEITTAVGQPTLLQFTEPFPGFYLLSWQAPSAPVDGYVVYRNGSAFGATTSTVFVTTQSGVYVVRARRNSKFSDPTNPVTIP